MTVQTTRVLLLVAGLAVSLAACGSDSPADGGNPTATVDCPDVQGEVTSIDVNRSDWAGAVAEFNGRQTLYTNTVPLVGVATPVIGPGSRVLIQVSFRNPLRFVSKDPWRILLSVEGQASGYQGESAERDPLYTGDWSGLTSYLARCFAAPSDYVLTGTIATDEAFPAIGEKLDCIIFDYTIPATLNIGAAPKPASIPLTTVTWLAILDGDHRGDPPPIEAVSH